MLSKIGLWLYQPYKYLFLLPISIVDTVFFAFFTWVFSFFSARWAGYMAAAWAKVIRFLTPMPVKLVGRENIDPKQSYVIVANHQSAYDIIMVYSTLPIDFRWIMKKELRKVPVLGFACECCGHIFIDRSSARAAWRSIQKAKEVLVGGTSVVIFPEGHRSGSNKMGTFKHGALKMAFELGLPILPVSIKDTYKVMNNGLPDLRPERTVLTIHKPIDVKPYIEKRDELTALLQETIATAV